MQDKLYIQKIAILGAGVMGAQIAAHCVNSGFKTLLYDLASDKGGRSHLVEEAVKKLTHLSPSPLAFKDSNRLIEVCNYDDDLTKLSECTLVIEAIAERLDLKLALYERIIPFLTEQTYLVTNTSGLSVSDLARSLPHQLQNRFCGVHFFNPPRYMHLVELIPSPSTSAQTLDALETWITSMLGKGVVRAKDTPNFIANRIGVFSLLSTLYRAEQFNLNPSTVDALTGLGIGRPKSATYRTLDVVGLDTMLHVVNTMKDKLKTCPWHQYYALPTWIMHLIEQRSLGQKTGQGIYKKVGQNIEVFNSKTYQYEKEDVNLSPEIIAILKNPSVKDKMAALFASNEQEALFLKACFLDLFHYASYYLTEIAQTTRDVDNAMCWGFAWSQGPFSLWQEAGFTSMFDAIEQALSKKDLMANVPCPIWLSGIHHFYEAERAYNPQAMKFEPPRHLRVYEKQHTALMMPSKPSLFESQAIKVCAIEDEIWAINFKTKGYTLDMALIEGFNEVLTLAENKAQGLIIYQNDTQNFCLGANLAAVLKMAQEKKYQDIEALVQAFQNLVMRIKYSPIPVVAALRGRALGGGAELVLNCAQTTASFESYMGLVELGVGLIPAGGGCKELALRAAKEQTSTDLIPYLLPYFNQIARGEVSLSAWDARRRNLLKANDIWLMHSNEVLNAAVMQIKAMTTSNYKPPLDLLFPVAGRQGAARLEGLLVNMREGQFISEYDFILGQQLARVLCGGPIDANTLVDETWFLKQERDAFMQLVKEEKTQARMAHMLATGKPLRN